MKCGGTGATSEANDNVKQMCTSLKGECESQTNKAFAEFTAISFTQQVVAGTNFFVKVHVGAEQFVHVRIFRPLPGQGDAQLHSVQHDKARADEIAYF